MSGSGPTRGSQSPGLPIHQLSAATKFTGIAKLNRYYFQLCLIHVFSSSLFPSDCGLMAKSAAAFGAVLFYQTQFALSLSPPAPLLFLNKPSSPRWTASCGDNLQFSVECRLFSFPFPSVDLVPCCWSSQEHLEVTTPYDSFSCKLFLCKPFHPQALSFSLSPYTLACLH